MRHITDGRAWTEEEIDEFLTRQARHLAQHGFCLGALCLDAVPGVAGLCGMQPLGTTNDVEVGWWLAPEHWGQGLATEAARSVLAFARDQQRLSRLLAIARSENRASTRIMEKLGMQFAGIHTGAELGLRQPDIELATYSLELRPSAHA